MLDEKLHADFSSVSFPTWGPKINDSFRRVIKQDSFQASDSGLFFAFPHFSAQDGGISGEGEERPSESCLSPQGGWTNKQS